MGDDQRSVRVRVTGRVQRVGFRAWTARQADARGIAGWVRNEPDGAVAVVLSGPAAEVEALLALLAKGPRGAAVASIEVSASEAPERDGFSVTY